MFNTNCVFLSFNSIFLTSGCLLISLGFVLFYDFDRVLLSIVFLKDSIFDKFDNPLFFYAAYALIILGLSVCFISLIGFWISHTKNQFLMFLYFSCILILLISKCVFFTISWIWPQCLGLNLSVLKLSSTLQSNYGVPEQELFTAAIDMAQTYFHCCGILSWTEYENSLWKLKSYGNKYLNIPLSCCKLQNEHYYRSYLNPEPENSTLCQNLDVNGLDFRFNEGCLDSLEQWYNGKYSIFVIISLTLILIEFAVLLSTLLSCTKIYKRNYVMKSEPKPILTTSTTPTVCYSSDYCSDSYILSNSFRRNYKLN